MIAHLNQAVVIPKSVPFPLHSIITTALQKLPQKRFDSAKEMIKAVNLAMEVLQATQPKACICLPEQTSEEISDQASTIAFRRSSSICQVPWESPIDRLTVDGRQIYATVNQASTHPVDAKDRLMTDATTTVWQLPNDAIIEQIHQCAKGYFVLTRSHHTPISTYTLLYRSIPLEFSQVAQINSYTVELGTWQAKHMLCTIDPLGNWLAIAVQHEQSAHSYDTSAEPGHVSTQFQILRLPGLKPLHTPVQWGRPEYLLTLDHRHGLAILPDTQSGEKTAEHNVWRLFNRRGKFFDYCRLPANCGPVARSITLPYQLLTIEAAAPTSALLINLKPLKVVRLALNFSPTFIVATYQGYVLADQSGQMLLVDYHGVKQCEWKLFDSSDQQLTAMAVSETDEILVATWSGQMASIDTLTMHQLLAAA
jgi:serine/threonine-protein kinase